MNIIRLARSSEIPIINKSLSWNAKGLNVVVARVEGVTKLLGCSPDYFSKIMSVIDGTRTFRDVVKILSRESSEDLVEKSLNSLRTERIIVCETNDRGKGGGSIGDWVAVLGDGALSGTLCKMLDSDMGEFGYRHLELGRGLVEGVTGLRLSLEKQLDDRCVFIIACPDQATYEMLLVVNDLSIETGIPVVFCYFNGVGIKIGPTVIPWMTACFGCLLALDYSHLGKDSGIKLELGDILPLVDAWPIDDCMYDVAALKWASRYVVSDVVEFLHSGRIPRLVKKQILVPPYVGEDHGNKNFEPISTCSSCSGMNRRGPVSAAEAKPGLSANVTLIDKEAVYQTGGLRSVTGDGANEIINDALKRIDHEVNVERSMITALDRFLFKYIATIVGKHNPRLPFLMPPFWMSRGKGLTDEQAYLSAAFELFERLSAIYQGDMEIVRASYKEVQETAIDVSSFIGEVFFHNVMDHFTKDTPIDWVWGHSLVHNRPVLVPASMVFITGRFLGHFFEPSSGGLASGAALEDAILQGLLEVIEHDSWMIWQANAIGTPEIELDTIKQSSLRQSISAIQECGFKVILRNCATDFSIPVVKAWVIDDRSFDRYAYSGWGANLNPDIAVERALTEANQCIVTKQTQIYTPYDAPNGWSLVSNVKSLFGLYSLNRSEIMSRDSIMSYSEVKDMSTGSVSGDIRKLVSLVQNSLPNVDVVIVNLTKPEFGVPVVRAVVGGGLQRFGKPIMSVCRRLFELPVKLGYREKEAAYNELYLGQFPH